MRPDENQLLSPVIRWPFDVDGRHLEWGDVVRDTEDGSAWVLAFNDPLDKTYNCWPVLLHAEPRLLYAERQAVDALVRMRKASDQPNVKAALERDGFLRPCSGTKSLENGLTIENDSTAPANRADCGCRHAKAA